MTKAALAGLVLCLALMAMFFFAGGFLSGLQVGWRQNTEQVPPAAVASPPSKPLTAIPSAPSTPLVQPAPEGQDTKSSPSVSQTAPSPVVSSAVVENTVEKTKASIPLLVRANISRSLVKEDLRRPPRYAFERKAHRVRVPDFEKIFKKSTRPLMHSSKSSFYPPKKPSVVLRVGYYPTPQEAQEAAQHVKASGYQPSIHKLSPSPHTMPAYRVRAGIFTNTTVAKKALKKLKNQGFAYAVLEPLEGAVP